MNVKEILDFLKNYSDLSETNISKIEVSVIQYENPLYKEECISFFKKWKNIESVTDDYKNDCRKMQELSVYLEKTGIRFS